MPHFNNDIHKLEKCPEGGNQDKIQKQCDNKKTADSTGVTYSRNTEVYEGSDMTTIPTKKTKTVLKRGSMILFSVTLTDTSY